MGSRQRPLQTCWISLLEISRKAYTTASRNYNVGDLAVNFASPSVICALQCQFFAILAFLDDWILRIESLAEAIFPPLKQFFDRIDELVKVAEALPEKLDDTIKKFPALVHHVPFLDWALLHFISWLRFLITVMTNWGIMGAKEKEINVTDVNNRRNDGLTDMRRRKKKKKTMKMDVQINTSKEGSNHNDQPLTREEVVAGKKLISVDPDMIEGKPEIVTDHHADVQTIMIDGLMVQQEPDRLTILAGNEAMIVHERNNCSLGVDEKCTSIDPKIVEESKETTSTGNEEPMKIVPRDIDDQTSEADRMAILQEVGHQTFPTSNDQKVVKDIDENNDKVQRINKTLTSNYPKTTEGAEQHILTSNEHLEITAHGTTGQTFTSNGLTSQNAYDNQALQTSNDVTLIQKSNGSSNVVEHIDQRPTSDNLKTHEGTIEECGLTGGEKQEIAIQENDDLTSSSKGLKIGQEATNNNLTFLTTTDPTIPQENGDEMLPCNESDFDPSITRNGPTLVSETDDTTMDSDCSQIKLDHDICAPFPKERLTSVAGIPGTSWSNVVKGSYKDVLEKGKYESLQESYKHRGLRQDKSRRQGKKAGKGTQEEGREGKGRRKGKRKKVGNKVESFSDY
ncbi:unnamed protein product [Linum trigynum]|uniref:Uncharacterized protein n=1 Tax=Linum trigynum TaxID=586398 RepID=A0AAV2CGH0_9ROSI